MILHLMSRSRRSRRLLSVDLHRTTVGSFLGFSAQEFSRPVWPLAVGVQWVWQSRESYPLREVLQDLISCFELGVIEVTGSERGSTDYSTIPAIKWGALQLFFDREYEVEAKWKGTFQTAWTNLRVKREDIMRNFASVVAENYEILPAAPPVILVSEPNQGGVEARTMKIATTFEAPRGRRRKYDRDAFFREVGVKLSYEGGLAPANGSSFIQRHLEDHMLHWCQERWEEVPKEAQLRKFVSEGIKLWKATNLG